MTMRACLCSGMILLTLPMAIGQDSAEQERKVVKIGAVGNRIKTRIFENLATVLTAKGYPAKVVGFSSYDAMVDALDSGEIDIAWNSPMSHAQFHVMNQCQSQTLAMRDVDVGLQVTLVASGKSGIKSLEGLAGKRVIIGRQKYHEGMLSAHFLKQGVEDFDQVQIVSLPGKDNQGNRTDTSSHILDALAQGKGDAAVVPTGFWKSSGQWREENPDVHQVWTSPQFNHCVFTASKDFDAQLGAQFTRLMTTLDPSDPLVAELNRLERTRKWLPGDSEGFESLIEAVQSQQTP